MVGHEEEQKSISALLDSLDLGSEQVATVEVDGVEDNPEKQRRLLWSVLAINLAFFIAEAVFGYLANSMGLVADSLDMLADAVVYGLSLMVVGHSAQRKRTIAGVSGYFQLGLAAVGLIEVVRRFLSPGTEVDYRTMIAVAFAALVANAVCLYILRDAKGEEAHMEASKIFTSNDIAINLGVIFAGFLVFALNSRVPDLVVGAIVFVIVTQGALRILKLSKNGDE